MAEVLEKEELFARTRRAMGIMTTYQDEQLKPYFDDVIQFLKNGGADEKVIFQDTSVGVIARGICDLWNYGSGGTELSPYFIKRAIQLCSEKGG